MTHDEYVEIIKDTLQRQLLDATYSFVLSKVTWLAWGPLAPLTKKILEELIVFMVTKTELAAYLMYTDFRTSKQGREYYEAAVNNYNAQRGEDELAKKRAEKQLKDSFRNLVKLAA